MQHLSDNAVNGGTKSKHSSTQAQQVSSIVQTTSDISKEKSEKTKVSGRVNISSEIDKCHVLINLRNRLQMQLI